MTKRHASSISTRQTAKVLNNQLNSQVIKLRDEATYRETIIDQFSQEARDKEFCVEAANQTNRQITALNNHLKSQVERLENELAQLKQRQLDNSGSLEWLLLSMATMRMFYY